MCNSRTKWPVSLPKQRTFFPRRPEWNKYTVIVASLRPQYQARKVLLFGRLCLRGRVFPSEIKFVSLAFEKRPLNNWTLYQLIGNTDMALKQKYLFRVNTTQTHSYKGGYSIWNHWSGVWKVGCFFPMVSELCDVMSVSNWCQLHVWSWRFFQNKAFNLLVSISTSCGSESS